MASPDYFLLPGECLNVYICDERTHIDHVLNYLYCALKWTVMYYRCLPLPFYNKEMQYYIHFKAAVQITFGLILLVIIASLNEGCME